MGDVMMMMMMMILISGIGANFCLTRNLSAEHQNATQYEADCSLHCHCLYLLRSELAALRFKMPKLC